MLKPKQNQNQIDWEKEFDNLPSKKIGHHHYKRTRHLKDFIDSLLSQQETKLMSESQDIEMKWLKQLRETETKYQEHERKALLLQKKLLIKDFRAELKASLSQQQKELRKQIEQIKQAVAARHGTQKYDSCYDDVIDLLK